MISPKFHLHHDIQAERFCRYFGQNIDNRAYKLDEEVRNVVSAYIWRAMDGELNPNRDDFLFGNGLFGNGLIKTTRSRKPLAETIRNGGTSVSQLRRLILYSGERAI